MTKTKVDKKKIKQSSRLLRKIKDKCDKNRGCQVKFNKGMTKIKVIKKKINPGYKKIKIAEKKKKLKIVIKIKFLRKKLKVVMTKN